jgi:hypothetical protein
MERVILQHVQGICAYEVVPRGTEVRQSSQAAASRRNSSSTASCHKCPEPHADEFMSREIKIGLSISHSGRFQLQASRRSKVFASGSHTSMLKAALPFGTGRKGLSG